MKWPDGILTDEEIKALESKPYDNMAMDEKLMYIFTRFGKIETPTEDNTTIKKADKTIEDALGENEKVFEMLWYLSKDNPFLKAVCKVWRRYYTKRGKILKFKQQIYKMRNQQEWLKKKDSRRRY